jgi:hypothetical protein
VPPDPLRPGSSAAAASRTASAECLCGESSLAAAASNSERWIAGRLHRRTSLPPRPEDGRAGLGLPRHQIAFVRPRDTSLRSPNAIDHHPGINLGSTGCCCPAPKAPPVISTSGRLAISRLPAPLNQSVQAMPLCSTYATGLPEEWCRPASPAPKRSETMKQFVTCVMADTARKEEVRVRASSASCRNDIPATKDSARGMSDRLTLAADQSGNGPLREKTSASLLTRSDTPAGHILGSGRQGRHGSSGAVVVRGTTTHTSVRSAIDAAMCGLSDFEKKAGCFAVYPERVLAIVGSFERRTRCAGWTCDGLLV